MIWRAAPVDEPLTFGSRDIGFTAKVAFSPNADRLVVSRGGKLEIWEVSSGKSVVTVEDAGHGVAFSPNGQYLALGGNPGQILHAATGKRALLVHNDGDEIGDLTYSPNGQFIAGGSDKRINVWDATNGKKILSFVGHSDSVTMVAFSPDSRRIVSASADKKVKIWDLTTGNELLCLDRHSDTVHGVSFSPDGQRIASASRDKTVRLWEVVTGRQLLSLNGHADSVTCVAFSKDGQRIASGGNDKRIKIWDVTNGKELFSFGGHTGFVTSVAWGADGLSIASSDIDGIVNLWEAKIQSPEARLQRALKKAEPANRKPFSNRVED
jgi:WD40 repeat protein